MNIKLLCYELYKIDWVRTHISTIRELNSLKKYYMNNNDLDYKNFMNSYNNELNTVGYDDEMYVSFDEFIDNEFNDKEYIKSLLNDNDLYNQYLDVIK